jgi:eukaryotic-like serine/threonine-protein kinase
MSDPDPLVGQHVSHYEILRRLGQGGMGVVYLGKHITLEREVAIKFLAAQLSSNQDYVDRFLREARAAARLNHPNLISVYDAGCEENVFYFVMEYVEGRDLAHILKERKFFEEASVLDFGLKAANALVYAHKNQVVHRDIKPENLILTHHNELKVGDLGLAKQLDDQNSSMTLSGVVMGTPFYISPEQVRGARDVDARTDIYSLGATLYHLVTGAVPFRGATSAEIMSKHLTEAFPWPQAVKSDVSESLCRVLYKMMAKDVSERFQSMEEVIGVLSEIRAGTPSATIDQIAIPESAISVNPHTASTQITTMPSSLRATGSAPQAAPSMFGNPSHPGQMIPGQPTVYTIPPTAVANRIGIIVGICVIFGLLSIAAILWFALNKKQEAPKASAYKLNLEESAKRLGFVENAVENSIEKKLNEEKIEPVLESAKSPLPPQPTTTVSESSPAPTPIPAPTQNAVTKPIEEKPLVIEKPEIKTTEKPVELTEKHIEVVSLQTPLISAAPSLKNLLDSNFESDVQGSLPKNWRAYIQEVVLKGEKSKDPYWASATTYKTADGTEATWEIFKTQEAFDGSQVLRIIGKAAGDQKAKYRTGVNGNFQVEAHKNYVLEFHARAAADPLKGSLRFGAPGNIKDFGLELNDEWKEIKIPFEPSNSGNVGVSIILTSLGEMWIDGVKVIQKN